MVRSLSHCIAASSGARRALWVVPFRAAFPLEPATIRVELCMLPPNLLLMNLLLP